MKKIAALMATAAMALTIGGISVAASDDGYHGPGKTCDAGHGAFGAFAHMPGTVESLVDADQAAGISLGSETGPANSLASQACNG